MMIFRTRQFAQDFRRCSPRKADAMAYLKHRPSVRLTAEDHANGSKFSCFAADLHPQPISREDIEANRRAMATIETCANNYMQQAWCNLAFASVIADDRGVLLVVQHEKKDQMCNVRRVVLSMFKAIPDEQKQLLGRTFRTLDHFDAERVSEWVSLEDLRPIPPKKPKFVKYTMEEVRQISHETLVGRNWPEWAEEGDERNLLALTDVATSSDLAPRTDRLQRHWVWSAETRGTIVIVTVGEWPDNLDYIPCKAENRRKLLIEKRIRADRADHHLMVKAARAGKRLCDEGLLFKLGGKGERTRRKELITLCGEAAKLVDANTETTISNLSEEAQWRIRVIFGGADEAYDGCLAEACLEYDTTDWMKIDLSAPQEQIVILRCSRCYMPKTWGRGMDCKTLQRIVLRGEGRPEAAKRSAPCDCEKCTGAFKKRRGI